MTTTTYHIEQLEKCNRQMFGELILTCPTSKMSDFPPGDLTTKRKKNIHQLSYRTSAMDLRRSVSYSNEYYSPKEHNNSNEQHNKRRASDLLDELLMDIYSTAQNAITTDYNSATSGRSSKSIVMDLGDVFKKDVGELSGTISCLQAYVERMGSILVRQLKRRDALRRQQDSHCDVITRQLSNRSGDTSEMRFSIQPSPGESGFSQWAAAMKMVAQLPGGIPTEFRYRLWIQLADRHLTARKVDWLKVERNCFSEWSHPTDAELGVQIVKDLHRTGCSLFCGEDGVENQALLKRVLLAYARWNKAVGYCQGFNMLAALILQVTEKNESDALKLMIYLIEGVLPDSYFADSLRGLSVDMAVFRELLKARLPRLSRHLDRLQNAAKDGTTSYEPPLTNVFTMQWFLTLFCNCLPQPTVLRVWDLILLEGNEILLRTALAIWQQLAERILNVRSADEFYCLMGVLTRELLEFDLIDGNTLIKTVVSIGQLNELKSLREHYLYNINPWTSSSLSHAMVDKQLKLYPRERLALDITALKKQYAKLKQRQRQAHIIFSAAISRQPPPSTPVAMNHLLLGKSALVTAKRLGPPKGSIPPVRQQPQPHVVEKVRPAPPPPPTTLHWKDTKPTSSSSSSDTELCDDEEQDSSSTSSEHHENVVEEAARQLNDNPIEKPSERDNNLMNLDNTTTSAKISASLLDLDDSNEEVEPKCSIEPSIEQNETVANHSDDEGNFDFELFLADRVAYLKSPDNGTAAGSGSGAEMKQEDKRVHLARRNSERALQIIQENSIILHRILQCQSRLSPSPPPMDGNSDLLATISSAGFGEEENVRSWLEEIEEIQLNDKESPEYGSRYTSILEKSKSLDEKYNSLILNSSLPRLEEKTDVDLGATDLYSGKVSPSSYSLPSPLNKYNPTWTQSEETLEEVTVAAQANEANCKVENDDSLKSFIDSNPSTTCYTYLSSPEKQITAAVDDVPDEDEASVSAAGKLDDVSPLEMSRSPTLLNRSDGDCSTSNSKVSEKHFNPFPLPINSRQNSKEVPLKLGLYKK